MVGNPRLRDANYKTKLTSRLVNLQLAPGKTEASSLGWDPGCAGSQLQSKVSEPGWFGSPTSCCNGLPKNSEPSSPWNPPYSWEGGCSSGILGGEVLPLWGPPGEGWVMMRACLSTPRACIRQRATAMNRRIRPCNGSTAGDPMMDRTGRCWIDPKVAVRYRKRCYNAISWPDSSWILPCAVDLRSPSS